MSITIPFFNFLRNKELNHNWSLTEIQKMISLKPTLSGKRNWTTGSCFSAKETKVFNINKYKLLNSHCLSTSIFGGDGGCFVLKDCLDFNFKNVNIKKFGQDSVSEFRSVACVCRLPHRRQYFSTQTEWCVAFNKGMLRKISPSRGF